MHPVGAWWVDKHHDYINGNLAQCQACHGTDYRGTELSRAFAVRTFTTELGTKRAFRGATVGCYMCHNGPFSSSATPNHPPVVSNVSAPATSSAAVTIPLLATDADNNSLTFRVVSQPANGAVAIPDATKAAAVYKPLAGWSGTETFTYTANDGWTDSESVGTVTVTVTAPVCTVTASATVPSTGTVGTAVSFSSTANASGCSGGVSYAWNFGDGNSSTAQNPSHVFASAGTYTWSFQATAGGVSATPQSGTITISTSPQASGPVISSIQQLSDPFRLRIDGSNFQSGVKVYIGNDGTAWPNVTRSSGGTRLTLSGTGLSAKFPVGQAVPITVVNPDGQSVTRTFTRQ
jgi:PKD repeat protein